MKKQVIIAVLLFVSLGIFSQDAVTEVKESINQPVLLSENYMHSLKIFSTTGLTYVHPVDQIYIKYDPKVHTVEAHSNSVWAEEINQRSVYTLILIAIYGFICICTITKLVRGYVKYSHLAIVGIYITALLGIYLSCFFFTTATAAALGHDGNTVVLIALGISFALIFGMSLDQLLGIINPTETDVFSAGTQKDYSWYRFGMRIYTFIPFILAVAIIANQSTLQHGVFDVSIVIGFYILCAAIYFGIKKLIHVIQRRRPSLAE